MSRARDHNNPQVVVLDRCRSQLAEKYSFDRFAEVFGTTRGSNRVELSPEQEADERDSLLRRKETSHGDVSYYNHAGKLHRETGPAVVLAQGSHEWWLDGKKHREDDLPAVERPSGTREWWQHGKLHRKNGPAIEHSHGARSWMQRGLMHRENGPAVELHDGTRQWYLHGKRHRADGPAVERADGSREWWQDGVMKKDASIPAST